MVPVIVTPFAGLNNDDEINYYLLIKLVSPSLVCQ